MTPPRPKRSQPFPTDPPKAGERTMDLLELGSYVWETSRLAWWLGLPWRCKFRHVPVRRHSIYPDSNVVEARWLECDRCQNYLGRLEP